MRIHDFTRIMWDFNGTLLDDVDLCLSGANLLLSRRGLKPLEDREAYRRVFCFPVQAYYARLGLESEGQGFVDAAHEWVEAYRAGEHTAPLRAGALPLLQAIRGAGVAQGVLSATESVMLSEQLAALGIGEYFDLVLGRNDIYATDKSDIAARYAAAHTGERVLMIGDTVHDFETAQCGGFDCVLVEGGHQAKEVLTQCGCPVFDSFAALGAWLGLTTEACEDCGAAPGGAAKL